MRFLERAKVKIGELEKPPWYQESEYDEETLAYLRASLEKNQFFDPIIVRQTEDGKYWLADGWHRCKILLERGIQETEADIFEMTDDEYLDIHTATQIARGRTNPLRVAELVQEYIKRGKSVEEVAVLFGKNPRWVRLYLYISQMEPKYREALNRGQLSIGVIDEAVRLEDDAEINQALDYACIYNYTIPEMRRYVESRRKDLEQYKEWSEKMGVTNPQPPTTPPETAYLTKCGGCGAEVDSRFIRGLVLCRACVFLLNRIYETFGNPETVLQEFDSFLTDYKERKLYEELKRKFETPQSEQKKGPETPPAGQIQSSV